MYCIYIYIYIYTYVIHTYICEELASLRDAFALCPGAAAAPARVAILEELKNRGVAAG